MTSSPATDDKGRQHCFFPATGEIIVREKTGPTSEIRERIDFDRKTIHGYRSFVDEYNRGVTVDWNQAIVDR